MGTEVAPLTAVQEKIKDRIKDEFVSLIPDEMWSQMVQAVIDDFTRGKADRYSSSTTEAPMKRMIREAIEEMCREKIKAELAQHVTTWDGYGRRTVAEATEKMIRERAPEMLAATQAGMTQMLVENAIQNLRNSMNLY